MIITPSPNEDEAAAALAAVAMVLAEEEAQVDETVIDWRWVASGMLVIQGLPLMRTPQPPQWGNVERLRRAGHGSTGITGL